MNEGASQVLMEEDDAAQPPSPTKRKPDSPSSPPPPPKRDCQELVIDCNAETDEDDGEEDDPEGETEAEARAQQMLWETEDATERELQNKVCGINTQIAKEKAVKKKIDAEFGLTGKEALSERLAVLRQQAVKMNIVKATDTDWEKDQKLMQMSVAVGSIREGKLFNQLLTF
jgi:hypothetical protein